MESADDGCDQRILLGDAFNRLAAALCRPEKNGRMGTRNSSYFSYFPVGRIQKNKFHVKENTGNIPAVYTNTSIIVVVLCSVWYRSRAQFSISLFSLVKVFGCVFSVLAAAAPSLGRAGCYFIIFVLYVRFIVLYSPNST